MKQKTFKKRIEKQCLRLLKVRGTLADLTKDSITHARYPEIQQAIQNIDEATDYLLDELEV